MKESKIRVQFDMLERDIQALVGEVDLLRHRVRLLWEKGDMGRKARSFGEAMRTYWRKEREMSERTIRDDMQELYRRVETLEALVAEPVGKVPYPYPHFCLHNCPHGRGCSPAHPYSPPRTGYPDSNGIWRWVGGRGTAGGP